MDRQHTNWERDASLVETDSCSAKVNEERKTRQHARIFPPANNWQTTELHYLFTDGCGGMAHSLPSPPFVDFCVPAVTQQTATFLSIGTPKFELGLHFCTMQLMSVQLMTVQILTV